jgi:hypothetical protein
VLVVERFDLAAYDTDKSPEYLANYRREFGTIFDRPATLLEIGVQGGGSMLMWRDLLPQATIAGLDLNPSHVDDDTGRIRLYQGFQQDPDVLDRIAREVAPDGFDVIVDDASHVGEYTEATFWHLFPRHLKSGGVYVIDDWSCAYWPRWSDGHAYKGRAAFRGTSVAGPDDDADDAGGLERLRRRVRASARPVARTLPPSVKARLERVYMRAEGSTLQRRFPSHDYGLAGFVKQLLDACAVDVIRADSHEALLGERVGIIESVRVTPAQVFVRKR